MQAPFRLSLSIVTPAGRKEANPAQAIFPDMLRNRGEGRRRRSWMIEIQLIALGETLRHTLGDKGNQNGLLRLVLVLK